MDEQALLDQIAQLTAQVAAFESSTTRLAVWREEDAIQIVPEPATTVPLHTLIRTEGLPGDARTFRRVLEAVALGYNLPTPVKDIPRTWIPVLRDVHQARTEGATWGTAMTRAGLVPPVDPHAYLYTMRAELDGLYERIPPLVVRINRVASTSVVRQRLLQQLGQLLM